MCGRYLLSKPGEVLDFLAPVLDEPGLPPSLELEPRFNIAPTQVAPIVANRTSRVVEVARWGLIPSWAEDPSIGSRMINARGESLAEKPAFRDAFARRRCLVPADGFYEWQKSGKNRLPYFIHLEGRRPFAMAGLWDRWRAPDGSWLTSFTVVTCPPSEFISRLHDRMPVVLAAEDWDRWLARDSLPPEALSDLIAPSNAAWVADPVGTFVNKADHEGPECIESRPIQGQLF